jgi:type I restriction enzyme S subunit
LSELLKNPYWAPSIPKGWRCIPAKRVLDIAKDTPAAGTSDQFQRLSLTMKGVLPKSREDNKGLQPASFDGYQLLRPNQLVFKLIDLKNFSTSRVGISSDLGLVSPAYIVAGVSEGLEPRFAYYYFLHLYHQRVFNRLGGDGVRSALNADDLGDIPMVLPPLTVQSDIVRSLDRELEKIDEAIGKCTQLQKIANARLDANLIRLVSHGESGNQVLVPGNLPWGGYRPDSWEVAPLWSVANLVKKSNKGMIEDNLLSLSYGEVVRRDIESSEGLLPESFETYQIIERNTIVFRLTDLQNDQKSLRSARNLERGIITSAYLCIELRDTVDPEFFNALMRSYDLQKVFYAMGSGLRQSLNWDEFRSLPILLPPLSEQRSIVAQLNESGRDYITLRDLAKKMVSVLTARRVGIIASQVSGSDLERLPIG